MDSLRMTGTSCSSTGSTVTRSNPGCSCPTAPTRSSSSRWCSRLLRARGTIVPARVRVHRRRVRVRCTASRSTHASAAARPAPDASSERQLQRAAVLRRQPRARAAVDSGDAGRTCGMRSTALDARIGGGGTELLPALEQALAMPSDRDRSRGFVVVTDGYVAVGARGIRARTTQPVAGKPVRVRHRLGVNRYLIEGLARAGQGEPFVVLEPRRGRRGPPLRRVHRDARADRRRVRFEGLDTYDVSRAGSRTVLAPPRGRVRQVAWRAARHHLRHRHVRARRSRTRLRSSGARSRAPGALRSSGRASGSPSFGREALAAEGRAARRDPRAGPPVRLLTAVHVVRRGRPSCGEDPDGTVTVDQPLPLPKGVSNLAVAEAIIPSTPEPPTWPLLAVASLLAGFAIWRRIPPSAARAGRRADVRTIGTRAAAAAMERGRPFRAPCGRPRCAVARLVMERG